MKVEYLIFQILFLISFTVKGQIKYSGNFNTVNFSGIATYYYNNSPNGRIYNGNFYFSKNNQINISGKFKNNLKTGKWKFSIKNYKYSDLIMNYIITAYVSGYYNNGNLDGSWTLSRTKIISFSNSGFSQYIQNNLNLLSYMLNGETVDFNKSYKVIENSNANFKDNHFVKNFTYKKGKSSISGQFDDDGYFHGEWILKNYVNNILIIQKRKYYHGVLLSISELDYSTGDLKKVMDTTDFVLKFFNNFNVSDSISKINGRVYVLDNSPNDDYQSDYLDNAINIWYNNTSVVNSAYNFEIQRGSNEMTIYPERTIIYDYEKTIAEKERIEKARQDSIRKEREKRELLALLEKRKKVNYDLKTENPDKYNDLNNQISQLITTEIQNFSSNELFLKGKITFYSDTLGIKSYDFSGLQSNNDEFLKLIKTKLKDFEINSIVEKNYKLNTFANYTIDYSYYRYTGETTFKIKEKAGENTITYVNESPDRNIQEAIENYYIDSKEGRYQISYDIVSLNGKTTANFTTIKFKEDKHIGEKILKTARYAAVIAGGVIYYIITKK